MCKKSYIQPDFIDVQVEDTIQFNDIEEGDIVEFIKTEEIERTELEQGYSGKGVNG